MRKNKYIVFTSLGYYPEYGGVENSIRFLVKETKKQGYHPIVITAQTKKVSFRRLALVDGVPVVRFRFRPFKSRLLNFFFMPVSMLDLLITMKSINKCRDVALSVDRNQILCVFSQFIFSDNTYVAPGFSQLQSSPAMLNSSMSLSETVSTKLKKYVHNWFDRRALVKSKRVYVFSENMKRQAERVLGGKGELVANFRLTKPGVDSKKFKPISASEKADVKQRLRLPVNKRVILSVGRFVGAKGFSFLAEAANYLDDNAVIVIVGDGPELNSLQAKNSELVKAGKLIFPGSSHDTVSYYQAADFFVLSSVYEPLGQTLLEAGSCGTPIISFKNSNEVINATHEIFGDNACYVDEVSGLELSKKIISCLLMTEAEYRTVSVETRSIVKKSCSWERLAKELISDLRS